MTTLRQGQVSSIVCAEDLEYEFMVHFSQLSISFCRVIMHLGWRIPEIMGPQGWRLVAF
jgi:hypothetical protein